MAKPLVLPYRGEQLSFALNYRSSPDEDSHIDLAAVVFNRKGELFDVVHTHKPSACDGALVSNKDKDCWPEACQAVEGDDVIHMLPKKLDPQAEVIVFVASAPYIPGKANDLNHSSQLEFVIHYPDDEDHATLKNSKAIPLKGVVSGPPSAPSLTGLGNGHNSVIVAVAYLDKNWTVRTDLSSFPQDSYAHLVPELKKAILRVKEKEGVDLDAARSLQVDETEMATFTRQWEDRDLGEAGAVRVPLDPPAPEVTKLRLDIGWSVWKPKRPAEGEEGYDDFDPEAEPENTELQFSLAFYNADGEEVQQVNDNETEAEGVKVGREFEEPEPEEEPEKEEAEEGEGEGEEEGGEPKEPPPQPELAPKEDPYAFTLKHTVFLDLKALPKDVRCCVLVVSNFAGAGFQHVRHARVKVYNVSGGEDSATQKAPTSPPRELIDYGIISKFGMDGSTTMLALLKLYKEYSDSAFHLWKSSGCQDVAEYVTGGTERLRDDLRKWQEGHKAFVARKEKLEKDAEEEGEEISYDVRAHKWRYSVLGLRMPGESVEDAEHDMKNVQNYDGPLVAREARTYDCARVFFVSEEVKGDTYFGGYRDDVKAGPGVYLFTRGAGYVGQYVNGKREGFGVMIMPDGGLYEGSLAADRFDGHGQYRYPDGSVYQGSWKAGQKDGYGVYWDTQRGCLRGTWVKGVLKGEATYDQPALHYEGTFVQGVPAGPCQFTVVSHRTLDMDKFACEHIIGSGPTLRMAAQYAIPPGSGEDPKLDEDGNVIEEDDKPPLPAFPKYEGLAFASEALPLTIADVSFPPKEGLVEGIEIKESGAVPVPKVPTFAVPTGLVEAA